MSLLKKKKLTVPIFGIDGAGKTYALCALYYWASRTIEDLKIEEGGQYMDPKISQWTIGYRPAKTSAGTKESISLRMPPLSISHRVRHPVLFTTYDIAGDDYLGRDPNVAPSQSDTDYLPPTKFFRDNMRAADGVICVVDIVRNQDYRLTSKMSGSNWSLTSLKTASEQGLRLNNALDALAANKINMRNKPVLFAFSKSDFLTQANEEDLENLVNTYFSSALTKIGPKIVKKLVSTSGVEGDQIQMPIVRDFKPVIKYFFDRCI